MLLQSFLDKVPAVHVQIIYLKKHDKFMKYNYSIKNVTFLTCGSQKQTASVGAFCHGVGVQII